MSDTPNTSGVDPNLVFITQQIGTVLTTLGLIGGTVWLSLTGQIHDGEVVTLLMAALGVHVVQYTKPVVVPQTPVNPPISTPNS